MEILGQQNNKNIENERTRLTTIGRKQNQSGDINNEINNTKMRGSTIKTIMNESYQFNNFSIDFKFNSNISSSFFYLIYLYLML